MKLHYISPFLSFAAVLAAALGPTRMDGESGLGALTPFGWAVGGIAVLSLAATLVKARRQEQETERERSKALEAEAKVEKLVAATNSLLKPALNRIYRVLDFAFLLSHLGAPENPRRIREDQEPQEGLSLGGMKIGQPDDGKYKGPVREALTPERRHALSLDSDEWISSLQAFNYLPRRSFEFDMQTQLLTGRPDVLHPDDPHETSVPYALDRRSFPDIVSGETKLAIEELESALDRGGYVAFDADTLTLVKRIVEHQFIQGLIGFSSGIDRFVKNEDMEDGDGAYEDGKDEFLDREFWDGFKVSLIADGGIQIGPSVSVYRDFVGVFNELKAKVM